jgi:hypothetical protein
MDARPLIRALEGGVEVATVAAARLAAEGAPDA